MISDVQGMRLHTGHEDLSLLDWAFCEQEILLPVIKVRVSAPVLHYRHRLQRS